VEITSLDEHTMKMNGEMQSERYTELKRNLLDNILHGLDHRP
jgi:hypothetical protein